MPSRTLKSTRDRIFFRRRPNFFAVLAGKFSQLKELATLFRSNTVINYVANLTEIIELMGPIRDYPDKLHLITHLFYNKNLDLSPNCLLVNLCHIFNYASAVSL